MRHLKGTQREEPNAFKAVLATNSPRRSSARLAEVAGLPKVHNRRIASLAVTEFRTERSRTECLAPEKRRLVGLAPEVVHWTLVRSRAVCAEGALPPHLRLAVTKSS